MNNEATILSAKPLTVEDCLKRMNEIQRNALAGFITRDEKAEFRAYSRKVAELGYTLHHKSEKSGGRLVCVTWYVTEGKKVSRNTECEWIKTDVRPDDGYRTLKGDCTTRAMSFCLEGTMSYREIESRQYALAAQKRTRRNTRGTWEIVIREKGWIDVRLGRGVKRSVLARILRGHLTKPCISQSSGHVAAIDTNGCVRDTWDSRGGRVDRIYVHVIDRASVEDVLSRCGFLCAQGAGVFG